MLGLGLLDEVGACGRVSLGAVVGNFLGLSLRQCVFEARRIEIPAVGWRAGCCRQESASEPASIPSKPSALIKSTTTCFAHMSSPATERQTRPGVPAGTPRVA